MCPSEASASTPEASAPSINAVKAVFEQHFPDLWPAVEAGLSTCATLLLEDNSNPVTLILCGASGCGKSTATNMFDGVKIQGNPFTYRSDKFTTASFVSHSAQATREQLQEVDLLPKIKNKVLLTPELSPIFRGKADELTLRFSQHQLTDILQELTCLLMEEEQLVCKLIHQHKSFPMHIHQLNFRVG